MRLANNAPTMIMLRIKHTEIQSLGLPKSCIFLWIIPFPLHKDTYYYYNLYVIKIFSKIDLVIFNL